MNMLVNHELLTNVAGPFQEGMRAQFGSELQSPIFGANADEGHEHTGHHHYESDLIQEPEADISEISGGTPEAADDLSEEQTSTLFSTEGLVGLTVSQKAAGLVLLPAHHNIERLSAYGSVHKGFGLMLPGVGIVPAVVSPRSTSTELHLFYDKSEAILPHQVGKDDFRIPEHSVVLLRNAVLFQDPVVGGEHADTSSAPATESGHGLLGLRTLTSDTVMQDVARGRHIVHDLAATKTGILPIFSTDTQGSLGMFSHPRRKKQLGQLGECVVTDSDKFLLVIDSHYDVLDNATDVEELAASTARVSDIEAKVSPIDIVASFALLAASAQREEPIDRITATALKNMELV